MWLAYCLISRTSFCGMIRIIYFWMLINLNLCIFILYKPNYLSILNVYLVTLISRFIKRSTCMSFIDPIPLKILYCSIVCFHLEYYPLIWINNTSKQNFTLESVKILKITFYVLFPSNLILIGLPTIFIIIF